jgi:hypothetical protein
MFDDADAHRLLAASKADQAEAGAKDLGRLIGSLRKQLVLEGFKSDEVWDLCRMFFEALLDTGAFETSDNENDEE